MDPILEQLLRNSIPDVQGPAIRGIGAPVNLRPTVAPWKPRRDPNVRLGPDLQFEHVAPIETPDETVREGISEITGPIAKVLSLPKEYMDEGAREIGLIGQDQTIGSRLAQDILRPESELGKYIQEQAAAGDRTARNYIAGVEGATEGLTDPLNIALAPLGGPGAMAMSVAGLPGMLEGAKQVSELPAGDQESALIRTVAGLAAPVGLGTMWGAGHAGSFGEHGPVTDTPQLDFTPAPVKPVEIRPDMAEGLSKFEPPAESLPTLDEETRFADAIKAVKAIEDVQANPVSELNTNVWMAGGPDSLGLEAAHDVMQSPGALKSKTFLDALNSVTGEGKANLAIGDSRSKNLGHVQGFQGERGKIGAANPDINVAPAAIAHRLLSEGVPESQLVDVFYNELARTTVHEGTHTGQNIPGADAPVDRLMHGPKEFGELRIGDEAPETLTESQAFDFIDPQRQAEYRGVKDNLVALHKMSQDALTPADILDLAKRHETYGEVLKSPSDPRALRFDPVESLAEPTTFDEKLRVGAAKDLLRQSDPAGPTSEQIRGFESAEDIPAQPNVSEDAIEAARVLTNQVREGNVPDIAAWKSALPEHLQPHADEIWQSVNDYVKVNENPANLLSGAKLAKLTPEELKTFGRLKDMDPAEVLATARDKVEAAKLIVAAKHPGSPAETKALLAQALMQQHGIKPPAGPPPAAPPNPRRPLGPSAPPKVETVEDFVGLRQSLPVKQEQTARDFAHYREQGIQGLKDYESNPAAYKDLDKFFDDMLVYQQKYGVPIDRLENYLPHLFDGPIDKIRERSADITREMGKLGLRPGHTLARKLASYELAEKVYDLKPKFDNLADLAGKYRYMAEKAVADRQLFDFAKRNELISTVHKEGWEELPNFPVRHVETKAGTPVEIKYFGEPKFAQYINRALSGPSPVARILGHIVRFGRNIALGAGVPGTGWNGYGLILMNRYVDSMPKVAEGIGRVMYSVKDLTLTKHAQAKLEAMFDEIPDAVEHGLQLSLEGRHFQPENRGLAQRVKEAEPLEIGMPKIEKSKLGGFALKKFSQVGELISTFFDRPLTQRVAPLMKMTVYKAAIPHFLKKGLELKQAKIESAKWANTVMTGINWQRMGYSPELMEWAGVIFLAPDILHSNLRIHSNVVKSLVINPKSPQAKLYRRYAGTAFTLFVAQQLISKALTGRTAIDNPPGQAFNMYLGDLDKEHEAYLRPSLTANDWARLPFEIAMAISNGDEKKPVELLHNRLSTLVNWFNQFIDQRDYSGKPISGQGIPAGRALLNNADLFTQMGRPPQLDWAWEGLKHVDAVGDWSKEMGFGRKRYPEEIAAGLVEAPISFVKKRKHTSEPLGLFDFHRSNRKRNRHSKELDATENF